MEFWRKYKSEDIKKFPIEKTTEIGILERISLENTDFFVWP